jgi:hypothetical protein
LQAARELTKVPFEKSLRVALVGSGRTWERSDFGDIYVAHNFDPFIPVSEGRSAVRLLAVRRGRLSGEHPLPLIALCRPNICVGRSIFIDIFVYLAASMDGPNDDLRDEPEAGTERRRRRRGPE